MKSYEVEMTRILAKTVVIEVPDDINEDDLETWVDDNLEDIFDLKSYEGKQRRTVSGLKESEEVDIHLRLTYEDDLEYDFNLERLRERVKE